MISRSIAATLALAVALLLAGSAAQGQDELDDLKKRFEQRYPVLLTLKTAGKVGETWLGYVEAVKSEYLTEEVELEGKKITVSALVAAESADRKTLYTHLAKEMKTTPEKIAARNAKRNFEKAEPDQWLKTKDGWVKKKDLNKDKEEE